MRALPRLLPTRRRLSRSLSAQLPDNLWGPQCTCPVSHAACVSLSVPRVSPRLSLPRLPVFPARLPAGSVSPRAKFPLDRGLPASRRRLGRSTAVSPACPCLSWLRLSRRRVHFDSWVLWLVLCPWDSRGTLPSSVLSACASQCPPVCPRRALTSVFLCPDLDLRSLSLGWLFRPANRLPPRLPRAPADQSPSFSAARPPLGAGRTPPATPYPRPPARPLSLYLSQRRGWGGRARGEQDTRQGCRAGGRV